jgi:hypothetical protein
MPDSIEKKVESGLYLLKQILFLFETIIQKEAFS